MVGEGGEQDLVDMRGERRKGEVGRDGLDEGREPGRRLEREGVEHCVAMLMEGGFRG